MQRLAFISSALLSSIVLAACDVPAQCRSARTSFDVQLDESARAALFLNLRMYAEANNYRYGLDHYERSDQGDSWVLQLKGRKLNLFGSTPMRDEAIDPDGHSGVQSAEFDSSRLRISLFNGCYSAPLDEVEWQKAVVALTNVIEGTPGVETDVAAISQ